MAKKKKKKKKGEGFTSPFANLQEETIHGIWAVTFFILATFFGLSAFGFAGVAGDWIYKIFNGLFGIGFYLIPILFLMLAITYTGSLREHLGGLRIVFGTLFFVSSLALIDLVFDAGGGKIGTMISTPLLSLFDKAAYLILPGLALVSVLVLFDMRFSFAPIKGIFKKKEKTEDEQEELFYDEEDEGDGEEELEEGEEELDDEDEEEGEEELDDDYGDAANAVEGEDEAEAEEKTKKRKGLGLSLFGKKKEEVPKAEDDYGFRVVPTGDIYKAPPVSLLERDAGKPDSGDVKNKANIIKRTFYNFGIEVEMDEITMGSTVTRFALRPAEGTRLRKLTELQKELEYALSAPTVRIEAPIPGKALAGIEVPNKSAASVRMGNIISSRQFKHAMDPLTIALGKDIEGNVYLTDLGAMPHGLVAGTTGSGKSVMMHAIMTSLLYRNGPQELKFILIDPKRVELKLYKDIPHLLTPVITEAKGAIQALMWAAKEMDRRYQVLEDAEVQKITDYHDHILNPALDALTGDETDEELSDLPESMPYIVIIIDEMADLMSEHGKKIEPFIVRIAQKARAVGIHLILSTQRPSVSVITGNIKANIPTRMALKVPTAVDSQTILGMKGAEKLLGKGDMLYLSDEHPKPKRIQAPFVSGAEVKKVAAWLKKRHEDDVPELINFEASADDNAVLVGDDDDDDPLYQQARISVIEAGKGSTSYLQRKLRVGYSRAARLIDMLEERGVLGPQDGSKPREILDAGEEDEYEEDEAEEVMLNPGKKLPQELLLDEEEEDEDDDEEVEYEDDDEEEEEDGEDDDDDEDDEEEDADNLYSTR